MGLGSMALPSASAGNPYAQVLTVDALGSYPAPELAWGRGKAAGRGQKFITPGSS